MQLPLQLLSLSCYCKKAF